MHLPSYGCEWVRSRPLKELPSSVPFFGPLRDRRAPGKGLGTPLEQWTLSAEDYTRIREADLGNAAVQISLRTVDVATPLDLEMSWSSSAGARFRSKGLSKDPP
jgi:hypothetical protein